jgi:hypothetical protein
MGIILPVLEMPFKDLPKTVRSSMNEVSTVVADAVRDIARAVIGIFNFKGLFGALPKTPKFDSSYYDDMVKAATVAYDKVTDAAKKTFNAQELLITRAQQDADRRLERHYTEQDRIYNARYEREKRAIENSSMTESQKNAALLKLEKDFEAAKLAREIAREDAKVARDRAREDAARAREEKFQMDLLAIQLKHQTDLDAIRIAEDTARQKQADDELKRQDSLWFKVKGIFATAIEQMATIWLTRFIGKLISGSVDVGTAIAKNVGGALTDIAGAAGGIASGLLSSLGSIGSIITGITSLLDLFKGPQKQTDVTYWLKLQWELLQNSYNFYIGELTWKLNSIRDNIDLALKPTLWSINEKAKVANDYLKTSAGHLKTIADKIGNLTSAASGAVSTQPQLMIVHGTRSDPEYVMRASQLNALAGAGAGRGGGGVINVTMPIYLGTEKIDERMFRVANDRVEWLDKQYQRSNRFIPSRSIRGL